METALSSCENSGTDMSWGSKSSDLEYADHVDKLISCTSTGGWIT